MADDDETRSCCGNIWNSWVKLCAKINSSIGRLFYRWAGFVGHHPKAVIFMCIFIPIGLAAGFARFNLQSHGERLYFGQSNTATKHLDRAEKSFPKKAKPETIILKMKNGGSVLNAKAFKMALKLHEGFLLTEYNKICTRVNQSDSTVQGCLALTPLELFPANESQITDQMLMTTLVSAYNNEKLLMKNGLPAKYNLQRLLGKFEIKTSGGNTTFSGNGIRMEYLALFIENDAEYDLVSNVESKMLDFLKAMEPQVNNDGLLMDYNVQRMLDDNIAESSGGDIKYVVVAITLMCAFTTIVLSKYKDFVAGHFWVGMTGIGCILLGVGAAFGFVMACGQYYVAFVGTLPFLVLAVGIDDMFIIVDALDHVEPEIRGLKRIQIALGRVGASVTMTTITDMVAFAVSASSVFPAIQYFCTYAALSLMFVFLLILSLLIAVIALDIKRVEAGKWDLIPCKKTENYDPWKTSQKSPANKIMLMWAQFLMKTPVRIVVTLLCFSLLGVSIWGAINVEERFDLRELGTDGSKLIQFYDALEANFQIGYQIDIIQDDSMFDYTTVKNQDNFAKISDICANTGYMKLNYTINWMSAFLQSPICNKTYRAQCSGNNFQPSLQAFLTTNPMYESMILMNATSHIRASRVQCVDQDNPNWIWRKNSMQQLRNDLKKGPIKTLFPISVDYFYREQIVVVRPSTIQNLLICAIAILVITTPYLVNPIVILIIFSGFVALIIELFALMYIWDVALNSISMIISIMSIGFAVDYSAHIAHAFVVSNAPTPEQRVISAVSDVGASVLMGGISTFLGILAMALGQSQIFRVFFRMLFGIVVLGLLNGLLFLPVLLSLFCRTKLRLSEEDNFGEKHENELNEINGTNGTHKLAVTENKNADPGTNDKTQAHGESNGASSPTKENNWSVRVEPNP